MPRQPRQPGEPKQSKRKKSTYGSGSIYQRKDGRWVASFLHPENGKPIMRYAKTEKEAQKKLEDIKFELRQGTLKTGPRQKLKDYLTTWLETVQKPHLRPGPYANQRSIVNHQIIPALGEVFLTKLTPQKLQQFYNQKEEEGLEKVSVRNIHKVLHTALENAVRWDLIPHNICDRVTLPKIQKRKRSLLTKEQISRLFHVARNHGYMDAFIKLAVVTGMRHSEMLALQWEDLDFKQNVVHVRRSVTYVGGQGFVEVPPKTESGDRVFVLPTFVIEALLNHREDQDREKEQDGENWLHKNLVFPNRHGNYRHLKGNLYRYRRVLTEASFPPINVQDLRHNISTFIQKELNYSPGFAQALLGHSSPDITMEVYTHIKSEDPTLLRQVMDDMETLFGQK